MLLHVDGTAYPPVLSHETNGFHTLRPTESSLHPALPSVDTPLAGCNSRDKARWQHH